MFGRAHNPRLARTSENQNAIEGCEHLFLIENTRSCPSKQSIEEDLINPQLAETRPSRHFKTRSPETFLDSTTPSSAPQTETVQLNEVPVSVVTEAEGSPLNNTLVDNSVNQANLLARPRLVSTLAWTISDTYDSPLVNFSVAATLGAIPQVAHVLDLYLGFKGTLCVRIDVNGSVYHSGRLLASWAQCGAPSISDPYVDPTTNITLQSISQRSTLPCLWINPSAAGSQTLKLPVRTVNGMLSKSSTSESLDIRVVNPLKWFGTVGSLSALQVQVYAWIEDLELVTPIPQSEISGNSGRVISNVTTKIRGFASTFARSTADAVLTSVGLGSPALMDVSQPTYYNSAPMIKSDRPANAEKLTGHASFEEPITPLVSDTDPMDFKNIYTREAYFNRIAWSESFTGGLAVYPVTALITDGGTYTTGNANGGTQLLPMGMIAYPFDFWRGDIKFRLDIVAPKFVRGRIKLVYVPYGGTYALGSDTADLHCIYVDISESTEAEMVCPFSYPYPWCRSVLESPTGSLTPFSDTNGSFVIEVVEPLRANGGSVEINMFASAVHLEVANPNRALQNYYLGGSTYVRPQSSVALDKYTNIRDIVKLPSTLRFYQWSSTLTGQAALSIGLSAFPNYRTAASAANLPIVGEYNATAIGTSPVPTTYTTYLAWFSSAFLCSKGSIRFSLLGCNRYSRQVLKSAQLVRWGSPGTMGLCDTSYYRGNTSICGGMAIKDASSEPTMSVEVPVAANFEFRLARTNNFDNRAQNIVLFIVDADKEDTTPDGCLHQVLISAADDYSLDCFQFVPLLFVTNT